MNYRLNLVCLLLSVCLLGGGQAWGAPGDPLWEQTFNYLPNYDNTQTYGLAASASTLIVCGTASKQVQNPYSSTSLGFIRAYDVATGSFKWQGTPLTLASTENAANNNAFSSITINGNIAMVQGTALSYSTTSYPQTIYLTKTILRAYNIDTGQLIWENIKDGFGSMAESANNVATSNRVFIRGSDNPLGLTPCSAWVRAYQVPGTVLQAPLLLLDEK